MGHPKLVKYSFLDLKKRLEASLSFTVTDGGGTDGGGTDGGGTDGGGTDGGGTGPDFGDNGPHALVQAYIKYIWNLHTLHYDQVNESVVRRVQIYVKHLNDQRPTERKLNELLEDRELLVKKNRRLRRMAELSDDCEDIEKYLLEATVIRNLQHASDFDEFKGCKGTSIGGIIDWDGEWFVDGHLDRNISETQLEKYETELLELIDMEERAAWVKINLKNNIIDAARSVATKAVEEFKTNFEQTRQELQTLKHEVLRARLIERQIQEIKDDNDGLGGMIQVRHPTPTDIGPRKPGPPRDEDQAEEDSPEND